MDQERENRLHSRKQNNRLKIKIAIAALSAVTAIGVVAGVVYWQLGQKYHTVFFPGTAINGMDASGKSAEEVRSLIAGQTKDYSLSVELREGKTEEITGEAIGLHSVFDGSLEALIAGQDTLRWLWERKTISSHEIDTMIQFDEEKLRDVVYALPFMDEKGMKAPEDASISSYRPGNGYEILPETEGTKLDRDLALKAVTDAVADLKPSLSLSEAGVYEKAGIDRENPALLERLNTLNRYVSASVTYKFGSTTETVDGSLISQWITVPEDGNQEAVISREQVAAYVKDLGARYDTYNKAKDFKTSYGTTIKTSGGSYGFRINQAEETEKLFQTVTAGTVETREPSYSQTAASRDGGDIGDTYVEINLTAQHLFFYKDGKVVAESDFVSGNLAKGWGTPAGVFSLTYKQRNATLKGEGYRTPVDYWMPFNGGVGLHDATWRSSFGGVIYKTGGSHGCINLPHGIAKTIYENIPEKCPVICYNLDGTESGKSSAGTKVPETAPSTPGQPVAPTPTQPTPTQPVPPTPTQPVQPTPTQPVPPTPTQPVQPTPTQPTPTQPTPTPTAPVETGKAPEESKPQETTAPSTRPAPAGPGETGGGETKVYGPGA